MPEKIWREVLEWILGRKPPEVTAGDVAGQFDLSYPSASQLLERLRRWGNIRILGFDPAKRKNDEGGGRRRKVYEITEKGKKTVAWSKRRKK